MGLAWFFLGQFALNSFEAECSVENLFVDFVLGPAHNDARLLAISAVCFFPCWLKTTSMPEHLSTVRVVNADVFTAWVGPECVTVGLTG
jgi:hypothetical protein